MLRGIPHPFTSGYFGAHDWEQWQAAYQLYIDDRVEAALEIAIEIGVGFRAEKLPFFTMLEAEAATAAKSEVYRASDWLTIEWCPSEVAAPIDEVATIALNACETIARKFNWVHGIPTVITILTLESDQGYRLGYETPKTSYEKICVAGDSLSTAFFPTLLAHEYGHVIAENLSFSKIPTWLSEGCAMWGAEQLTKNPWNWLSAGDLESAFRSSWSPITAELAQREAAYQQAGWIVSLINDIVPIGQFLSDFPKESWWEAVRDRALARDRIETMVRSKLGMSIESLFLRAEQKVSKLS